MQFEDFGLSAFSFHIDDRPRSGPQQPPHTHLEIELDLVVGGGMVMDLAGARHRVGALEPILFWGGIPHHVVEVDPGVALHVAQVPITEVLAWDCGSRLLDRLLAGELLRDRAGDGDVDRMLFSRWAQDVARGADSRRAAALEIQARIYRLLASGATTRARQSSPGTAMAAHVAVAIRFLAAHFLEPVTVDDVAAACGLGRHHLMSSFRKVCGLTVWEHVTRLRVSEARRLLATTDLPILAVSERAGFGSVSRMYAAFRRFNGMTPREYRSLGR